MIRQAKTLTVLAIAAALAATGGCTTNPQTGQTEISKAALYGIGGALACGAIGATRNGTSARNAALACGAAGAALGGYQDYQEKQLREKLANTQIGVARIGDQLKLTLPENVTFDVDKYKLKPAVVGPIGAIGDSMVQYPNTRITVLGFTDSTGSAAHNQQLSERRAEAVTNLLATRGVDTARIRTIGRGASQYIASNANAAGRARNRRVEILIDPAQ